MVRRKWLLPSLLWFNKIMGRQAVVVTRSHYRSFLVLRNSRIPTKSSQDFWNIVSIVSERQEAGNIATVIIWILRMLNFLWVYWHTHKKGTTSCGMEYSPTAICTQSEVFCWPSISASSLGTSPSRKSPQLANMADFFSSMPLWQQAFRIDVQVWIPHKYPIRIHRVNQHGNTKSDWCISEPSHRNQPIQGLLARRLGRT